MFVYGDPYGSIHGFCDKCFENECTVTRDINTTIVKNKISYTARFGCIIPPSTAFDTTYDTASIARTEDDQLTRNMHEAVSYVAALFMFLLSCEVPEGVGRSVFRHWPASSSTKLFLRCRIGFN
ncbi:hypothetical protein HRG_000470 [Hirsutella rhossiliensis]|uniref:Uncharacterized protein n=1 Tax=Hirsutella rhossiliensis TaxID=111463 RepID=A0A9P8N570_9HYPO|nr:uncharacterized protein HRG_00470 [Hirsutella rhossiliensis]KAH0967828.1 hypothetical protein HRG_00470 [Hirsutella rhossiliensis]